MINRALIIKGIIERGIVQKGLVQRYSLLSPYLGYVATSTKIPMNLSQTANAKLMTRKAHYARDNITSLQLIYPNWFVNIYPTGLTGQSRLGQELGAGNSIAVNAWIEYPVGTLSGGGTYTQVKFSGGNTGTFANYTNNISDAVNVTIPDGALFYTWTYVTGSGGNYFPYISGVGEGTHGNTTGNPLWWSGNGGTEAGNYGTAGVPSSPGAITDNGSGNTGYFPAAIIGTTTKPCFYLLGDSRCTGDQENADASLDIGNCARSVGPLYAYVNSGVGGQRASCWFYSSTRQMELIQYAYAIINQLGVNDMNGAGPDQPYSLEAYNQCIGARFSGRPYSRVTLEPATTSSNSFVDAAGQTVANQGTQVGLYNTWVRSRVDGVPYSDIAPAVQDAGDPLKWKTNGTPWAYTPEGIHSQNLGALAIQSSGALNPTTLAATAGITLNYPSLTATQIAANTVTFGTGKFGQGMTGGQAAVPGVTPGCCPYTLEGWAKAASSTLALSPFGDHVLTFVTDASGNAGIYFLPDGVGAKTYSTTNVCDNNWHHLAMTADQLGNIVLYVDGISTLTYSTTYNRNLWIASGPGTLTFRASGHSTPYSSPTNVEGKWLGSIDEVAMWSFLKYTGNFTPPAAPYVGNETGLIGVWHLDGDLTATRGPGGM